MYMYEYIIIYVYISRGSRKSLWFVFILSYADIIQSDTIYCQ